MKQKEANECQKILKVWTKRYQELFQTYLDKQISDQDFITEKQICSEKKEEQEVKYKNLKKEVEDIILENNNKSEFLETIKLYKNRKEWKNEIMKDLIVEVVAYNDQMIEINWKFKGKSTV